MSRAFVNEDQAADQADQPVERRISEQPNYVTASGLRQLQTRVAELNALRSELQAQGERGDKQRLADTERDLRYVSARVQSAQVVPAATSHSKVQIGSRVRFVDEQGQAHDQRHADTDAPRLGPVLLGQFVGEDRDKDQVIDAQHDFHHDQGGQGDPGGGAGGQL